MEVVVAFLALAVLGLTLVAAVNDIRTMRIPNWIPLAVAGLFLAAFVLQPELFRPWWVHFVAAAVMLSAGFVLFAFGIMGAGDTKLASSLILWIGVKGLVSFVFFMAILGGLLGVAALWMKSRKPFRNPPEGSWVAKVQSGHSAVPYGVAISFGAIISFWQIGLLQFASIVF